MAGNVDGAQGPLAEPNFLAIDQRQIDRARRQFVAVPSGGADVVVALRQVGDFVSVQRDAPAEAAAQNAAAPPV